jgi:hypothetical protein
MTLALIFFSNTSIASSVNFTLEASKIKLTAMNPKQPSTKAGFLKASLFSEYLTEIDYKGLASKC